MRDIKFEGLVRPMYRGGVDQEMNYIRHLLATWGLSVAQYMAQSQITQKDAGELRV